MTIRGLLFDKDGTLLDAQRTWGSWVGSMLEALAGGDAVLFEVLAREVGFRPATVDFEPVSIALTGTPDEIASALYPHLPDAPSPSELARSIVEASMEVRPVEVLPLAPVLRALAGYGYKLGVATNDAEAPARSQFEELGIEGIFDLILGCDSGFGGKPGPGQVLAFAEAMRLQPSEVAMIGDSMADLMAGQAAGAVTVAVLTGSADQAMLAPFADAVLPDIGALEGWLASR